MTNFLTSPRYLNIFERSTIFDFLSKLFQKFIWSRIIVQVIELLKSNEAASLKWVGNVLKDNDPNLIKFAEALKTNTSVTSIDISGNTFGSGE